MYIDSYTPLQAEWIRRLRSGDYVQATGSLREIIKYSEDIKEPIEFAYCCLGVACETVRDSDLPDDQKPKVTGNTDYDNEGGIMPPSVYRAMGIKPVELTSVSTTGNPPIDVGFVLHYRDANDPWRSMISLTELNDCVDAEGNHLFTFAMIADVIEYFADQLFIVPANPHGFLFDGDVR